ncbi:MAG TPA: LysM peptidoglycan-binding domain-containing protein [Acidobacteriota bacterium]|nr:LysM peptidoglycan-binding domain-containing protein [Acidobacteriota bacterium]
MTRKRPDLITIIELTALLAALTVLSIGCGGARSMSSPQVYGEHSQAGPEGTEPSPDTVSDTTGFGPPPEAKPADDQPAVVATEESDTVAPGADTTAQRTTEGKTAGRPSPSDSRLENGAQEGVYYGQVDNADSAAAVDDDIWRLFDLAEEYHAMGVIANREASWEEAQYYFEKCLVILANLDVEADSVLTPEAVKYNAVLDNVVADYRVTLRSLGQMQGTIAPSVLIERFGELGERLEHDTLLVYRQESPPIKYDLPVVMNDRVRSSIIYFQTVAKDAFTKYLTRSKKYERLFKRVLTEHDLPHDLIYLSLVESGFNPNAYSWARAMGLWQFISSTGRLYGLKRDWWVDERKDPVKSTAAAARFLKDLYKEFGNWELAMAGYNGGPARVRRTMKKQKTIDFWKLRLKRQTMDYVPLIYAAAIIGKDPERYGFHDIEFEPEVVWDEVEIDRCLDMKVVAREIGCSLEDLKQLNPELLRNYTPPNTKKYSLKIPVGKRQKFLAAYDAMPSPEETSWVRHKIKRGETVSSIAARYGVSQYAILEANNLRPRSKIYAGRTLIVPVPLDRENSGSSSRKREYVAKKSIYIVRAGDTMWDIARAFGTSVDALRRINYIERGSRIYVGQQLRIPADASMLAMKSSSPRLYASNPSSSDSGSKPGSSKATATGKRSYKVKAGDTLWDIARAFGTTTGRIRRLNSLGRSSRIYPGQELTVEAGGEADYVIHQVKRGETLSRIALRYRTTIARILAVNNLVDPDAIQIGDKLKIYVK